MLYLCSLLVAVFVGALTDVNLPIDPASKRVKGFAHITYMFPEHAVQACNQLDGTNYMVNISASYSYAFV